MNWNATDVETATPVVLAVIKLPARVPVSDPRYGGPILLNPGGPGGSGVGLARNEGAQIQTLADAAHLGDSDTYVPKNVSAGGKFFDIIGWDPRGVGATTPWHGCFTDPRDLAQWAAGTTIVPGTLEGNLEEMWTKQMALAKGCFANTKLNPEGDKIVDFMTTEVVVRDMVEILEKHGQWREAELTKSAITSRADQAVLSVGQTDIESLLEERRYHKDNEPLQYWGFSYGTILGATFATLQPHRAHRMIVDGVSDSIDYYEGGWISNLYDTNDIMVNFFKYCHAAGPQNCSLALEEDLSPVDISARWAAVESRILTSGSIPVPGTAEHGPQVIMMSDIHNLVFKTLYSPMRLFPGMADLMAPLAFTINDTFPNATDLAAWKSSATRSRLEFLVHPDCTSNNTSIWNPDCTSLSGAGDGGNAATLGIMCRDGDPRVMLDMTLDEWRDDIAQLQNQSLWFGAEWARVRLSCAGWPDRPNTTGHWFPWDRSHGAAGLEEQLGSNATAHPMLFIGNTLDPVTPLRNAHKMAAKFKGAVVLQNDYEGHCTSKLTFCAVS